MKITQLLSVTAAGALVITGGVAAFRTAHAEDTATPAPAAQASPGPGKGGGHGCHGFAGKFGDHDRFARWQHFHHGFGGGPGGGAGPDKMLNLTPDQQQKVKAIFQSVKPQIEAIRKEEQTKIRAVLAEAGKQVRPLLNEQQQQVFDDMQKLRADRAALPPAAPAATPAAP
jgi:Spy/CpxP family protein refolding chaperone